MKSKESQYLPTKSNLMESESIVGESFESPEVPASPGGRYDI